MRPDPLAKHGMNGGVCQQVGLVTCPNCQVLMPRISLKAPERWKSAPQGSLPLSPRYFGY
jgi:hypothetical protein